MTKKDKKMCNSLWKELEPQVRNLCRAKLRNYPHEVDDIISQTFLTLCQKIDTDGFPIKPKAWIYGTCHNIICKKYNEIYNKQCIYIEDMEKELPLEEDVINTKIEELYNQQLQEKLHSFLTESEYQFVSYFYFQHLNVKETASILNITESAVRQRNYRICIKLKKILKNFDFFS